MGRKTHTPQSRFKKKKLIHMSTAQEQLQRFQARGRSRSSQGLCPPRYPLSCCAQEARGQSHGSRTPRARASVLAGQEGPPKSRDDCGTSSAGSAGPSPAVPTLLQGGPRVAPTHPAGRPTPVMLEPTLAHPPKQCRAHPSGQPPAVPSPPARVPWAPCTLPATAQAGWCRPTVCGAAPQSASSCPAEMGPLQGISK